MANNDSDPGGYAADLAAFRQIRDQRTPSATTGPLLTATCPNLELQSLLRNPTALDRDETQPRGTHNPNNLCYRNAVLSMLLCNDVFMAFVIAHWLPVRQKLLSDHQLGKPKHPLGVLTSLWKFYWSRDTTDGNYNARMLVQWTTLWNLESWGGPWAQNGRHSSHQRDAAEFLEWFIGAEANSPSELSTAFLAEFESAFALQKTARKLCAGCPQRGVTKLKQFRMSQAVTDTVWSIGLPSNNNHPYELEDLVRREFKGVSDGWLCDACLDHFIRFPERTDPRIGWKGAGWHYIRRLPELVFMQLKRFDYVRNEAAGTERFFKNELKVDIPQSLDLGNYLDPDSSMKDWERINSVYDLVGVISHSGTYNQRRNIPHPTSKNPPPPPAGPNSGHYISYHKIDDKWYCINNQSCASSSFEAAVSAVSAKQNSFTPYLLLWQRRIDVPLEEVVRRKAEDEAKYDRQAQTHLAKTPSPTGTQNVSSGRSSVRRRQAVSGQMSAEKNGGKSSQGASAGRSSTHRTRDTSVRPRPDSYATYLRMKVGLDGTDHYIHHRIGVESALDNAFERVLDDHDFVKVDLDLQLVREFPQDQLMHRLDLLRAAGSTDSQARLEHLDESARLTAHQRCACSMIHEGACAGLCAVPGCLPVTRKRCNDGQLKERSSPKRRKVQDAVNKTLEEWNTTWKHWQQPSGVVRPIKEARDRVTSINAAPSNSASASRFFHALSTPSPRNISAREVQRDALRESLQVAPWPVSQPITVQPRDRTDDPRPLVSTATECSVQDMAHPTQSKDVERLKQALQKKILKRNRSQLIAPRHRPGRRRLGLLYSGRFNTVDSKRRSRLQSMAARSREQNDVAAKHSRDATTTRAANLGSGPRPRPPPPSNQNQIPVSEATSPSGRPELIAQQGCELPAVRQQAAPSHQRPTPPPAPPLRHRRPAATHRTSRPIRSLLERLQTRNTAILTRLRTRSSPKRLLKLALLGFASGAAVITASSLRRSDWETIGLRAGEVVREWREWTRQLAMGMGSATKQASDETLKLAPLETAAVGAVGAGGAVA